MRQQLFVAAIAYAISSTVPYAFYGIALPVLAAMMSAHELTILDAYM